MNSPGTKESPEPRDESGPDPDSVWQTVGAHMAGVCALIWSGVTWAEWFLIPIFYPADGGPVPHLAFAPQAILLFLGCVVIILVIPVWAFTTRGWSKLLFASPAAAYVTFQVCRVV